MTQLEIINRALYRIGSQPATSTSDTARAAALAISDYEEARDFCLRLLPWPSCTKRALLNGWHDQATPWTASNAYNIGDRCTNDSDKTYECKTAGTSASSGGPTGTGTSITDGTVVWTYIEASTTANNWCWQPSTAYAVGDLVSWDTGKIYECTTAGTSDASTGPSGTASEITDGTVTWRWYGTPPPNRTSYDYMYVYPTDCLRLWKIPDIYASKESDQGVQYLREGKWIYCDQDESYARYIYREEDPDNWDHLLQETVALKVAADIAFTVTNNAKLRNEIFQEFASIYSSAGTVAMHEGAEGPEELSLWVDA